MSAAVQVYPTRSDGGASIKGEVHHGAIANVPISDALYHLQDVTKLADWGASFVDCVLVDNSKEGWELGCRRRTVIKKAPYTDLMVREELVERDCGTTRGRITLQYCPLTAESSFSALKLDTRQKVAKAAKNSQLIEPEKPSVSDRVGDSYNPYAGGGGGVVQTTPAPPTTAAALLLRSPNSKQPPSPTDDEEAPTLLEMTTTYTLSSLSAHGGCQTFIEVHCSYTLSCETPGNHDERILYDAVVLRSFLEGFWIKEQSSTLIQHLNNSVCPLALLKGSSSATTTSNNNATATTFQESGNSLKLPMPYAKEHIEYEKLATEFAVAAKTPKEEKMADAYQVLLGSWEKLLDDIRNKDEMVARGVDEVAAARHITTAANQLSSATMRAAVQYETDGKW